VGEESFRFYADQASAAPAAPPPPPPPPPPGAEARLQNTSFGIPVTPRSTGAPAHPVTAGPLANFLVRSGSLKGTRLVVKTPVANIGRADYNDLVIPDESVSTSHAKLQRREGVWVLVDLESTNGTFVDGERISADTPIAPGTMVRFGDIQLVFEPTDDALGVAKGGGTKVLESFKVPPAAPAPQPPQAGTPTAPPQPPPAAAKPAAAPAPPPPVAAKPAPAPAPAKPAAAPKSPPPKPAGAAKRPAPPAGQTPKQKGKGCGSSAAVIVLATTALVYWILA
jgi:hypothetical protein